MAKQGLEREMAAALLAWYGAHGRDLPWRQKGDGLPEPYRVWLSEIMLQQTTVQAARAYYEKFIRQWPTLKDLAAAPLDDVLRAWAGLGYYARARNLHACAVVLVSDHAGRFPETRADLLKLPGIGPYTSAAIAAIAFGARHAAVDGNAERVISRFYAIEVPLPASEPQIQRLAEALVPERRPGDFAQALMDLGATVCTPKSPDCPACPWHGPCKARKLGVAAELPRRLAKKPVPVRNGTAYWLEREDGAVLIRKRPSKGLLGGMMEVPSSGWNAGDSARPVGVRWRKLPGLVEHTFTHFHLRLAVLKAKCAAGREMNGSYRWVAPKDLHAEALPSLMRKVVAHVLGEAR